MPSPCHAENVSTANLSWLTAMMVSSREPSEMAVPCEKQAPGAGVLVGEPTAVPRWIAWRSLSGGCQPLFLFNNINSVMAMESFYQ